MNRPARAQALARQDEQIQANVARIEAERAAERAAPSALALMAARLNVSQKGLISTLKQTVFSKANDAEFQTLIIVANEYNLNPLIKEIYAFPAKGGGIVPIVSVDGWIRIMNSHPQFDGIDFNDIFDEEGKLEAIECVIYRKDRTRPIKVTEYLDECYRKTDPWDKSPKRMLRHKALIQCSRVAFGFSGISDPDSYEVGDAWLGGDFDEMKSINAQPAMPSNQQLEQYDEEAGEIIQTDETTGMTVDPQEAKAEEIIAAAENCATIIDLKKLRAEVQSHIDAMSDEDMAGACHVALTQAEARLKG